MFLKKSGSLKCRATGESGFTKMEIKASGKVIKTTGEIPSNEKTVELEAIINFEEWSNGTKFMCSIEHDSNAEPTEILYTRETGMLFLQLQHLFLLCVISTT